MTPEIFDMLWKIRDKGVRGNLLPHDTHVCDPTRNTGLMECFANYRSALEKEDRVGFRNSHYSLMFFAMVGHGRVCHNSVKLVVVPDKPQLKKPPPG